MMRRHLVCAVLAASSLLAACGERDQSLGNTARSDALWKGAKNEFVAKGWTPGTKEAWETQLRTRAQTQNEYNRTN